MRGERGATGGASRAATPAGRTGERADGSTALLHTRNAESPIAETLSEWEALSLRDRVVCRPSMIARLRSLGVSQPELLLADPLGHGVSAEHDDDERAHTPHLSAVPAYPVDDVPEPLRGLVLAGERAGLPREYVAAGGLGALAYAALDCRVIESDEWVEAPALWLPILGPASTAKSPAMGYGWAPIIRAEEIRRADDDREIEAWRQRPRQDRGPRPARTTRTVSDATVEALVRRLAEVGPQVLMVDELRSWLGSLGRYGSGGAAVQRDLGHYLSMWVGTSRLIYDRVGGDTSIVASEPAVSVIGTLQTEDHRLLGSVESGLRARWLPHLYRGTMPDRIDGRGSVPRAWTRRLEDLVQQPPRLRLKLTPDARQVWRDAEHRWRTAAEDASPGVRAAAGKAPRQALRVAVVLTLAMDAAPDVPGDAMHAAVAVVDYVLGVWRALPEGEELTLSFAGQRTSDAVDRLATWLERRPERCATRDRILRAQVAGIRTAGILREVLEHYEAVYPGSVVEGESTPRGGRRGVVVHAPRRENAEPFPRPRGNGRAYEHCPRETSREETRGLPRERPEESLPTAAPEASPPPEESAVDCDVWEPLAEVTP